MTVPAPPAVRRRPPGTGGPAGGRLATRAWVALAVACAASVAAIAVAAPPGYLELPLAHRAGRMRILLGAWSDAEVRRTRTLLDLEYGLIVMEVALLATACFWRAGVEPRGVRHDRAWRRPALLAACAGAAGACDVAENVLIEHVLGTFRRTGAITTASDWLFAVAAAKYVALATVVVGVVRLLPQRLPPPLGGPVFHPSSTRPEFLRPAGGAHPWQPPAAGEPPRLGVCCSGGGSRSAAFSLGALQVLRARGVLPRARYLAAVSGGSYLATGLATARPARSAAVPPGEPPPGVEPFAAGSPEERWLRANSSPLAPDRRTFLAGIARLLGGIGVNLVLVWLLLFAVARPIGWAISSDALHPELRAREPFVTVEAPLAPDARRLLLLGTVPTRGDDRAAAVASGAIVPVLELSTTWHELRVRLEGREVATRAARLPVRQIRSGVVAVQDGRLRVVRQPRVALDNAQLADRFNADDRDPVQVERQPSFGFHDDASFDARTVEALLAGTVAPAALDELEDRLALQRPPGLRVLEGVHGRPSLDVDRWMVDLPTGAGLGAVAVYLARLLRGDERWPFGRLHVVLALGAVAAALLLVVLPAAVVAVPGTVAWIAGQFGAPSSERAATGSAWAGTTAAVVGFVVTSAAALCTYLPRRSMHRGRLGRALPWAAGIVVPLVALLLFVDLVQVAAANGPFGQLGAFGLRLARVPDSVRWLGVLGGLTVLWRAVDAHAWSMYPFAKERLQAAYVLERRGDTVRPIPYDEGFWFSTHPHIGAERGEAGAELVVCAAANLSEPGRVPSGRRCVSFTFSPGEVGGPQVGYVPTAALEQAMGARRRRDLTMVAAMAISGAAVAPAMDAMGVGPMGRLLALLNLRRGVWLPHPEWVDRFLTVERAAPPPGGSDPARRAPRSGRAGLDEGPRWTDRPGWPYFLREVIGRFRFGDRYLYVSGGGQWEDLGLVELLRRGCTDIWCISATGGGPTSFATVAQAIGLAREELGVDVDIELPDLRSSADGDTPATGPYAVGRVRFPATARHDGQAAEGRVVVIAAHLSERIPADVQAFAASTAGFPHDATGERFLDHRQFEAYRRLGEHQASAALEALAQPAGPPGRPAADAGQPARSRA